MYSTLARKFWYGGNQIDFGFIFKDNNIIYYNFRIRVSICIITIHVNNKTAAAKK